MHTHAQNDRQSLPQRAYIPNSEDKQRLGGETERGKVSRTWSRIYWVEESRTESKFPSSKPWVMSSRPCPSSSFFQYLTVFKTKQSDKCKCLEEVQGQSCGGINFYNNQQSPGFNGSVPSHSLNGEATQTPRSPQSPKVIFWIDIKVPRWEMWLKQWSRIDWKLRFACWSVIQTQNRHYFHLNVNPNVTKGLDTHHICTSAARFYISVNKEQTR